MRHEGRLESLALNALMIGGGLFILWQVLKGVGGAAKDAAVAAGQAIEHGAEAVGGAIKSVTIDPLAAVISAPVVWWKFGKPLGVVGKIAIQSTGELIDPTSVRINWQGNVATINYRGVTYVLGPHDENGNYPAVNIGEFAF